jgi:amino acid transporter
MSESSATFAVPGVQRTRAGLGFKVLFAASIGVIVAQLGMVTLMQGIGIGGWGFIGAMFIAFVLALTNAMAYAEMALMMPSAGSLSSYAEAAVGNFPAILLVFAGYVTPAIFGLPVELILADQILRDALQLPLPPLFWPVALVVVFAGLNILGADVFAKVQTTLSFLVLAFLLVVGLMAVSGHAAAPIAGAGWSQMGQNTVMVSVVALAFWVFVGSEFVTPLLPEAANAARDLPRAMLGSLVTIFLVQLLFAVGAGAVIPRETLASSPAPHLDYALAVLGPSAKVGFAVLALLASASLLNSVLAAVPRMLQGMAENRQAFSVFKRLHPRFGTPVVSIVFVACLPLLGLAWSGGDPGAIVSLTISASVAWILAYVVAQISLMVLRHRHPKAERPYRVPLFPVLPLVAVAGMLFVVCQSSPAPELTGQIVRYTGIVLGLFAVVGALWVKLVMKRGLFEPVTPASLDTRF